VKEEFEVILLFKTSRKVSASHKWVRVKNISNSGKEAVTVYRKRLRLAERRSGWYPHPNTSRKIGRRAVSKAK